MDQGHWEGSPALSLRGGTCPTPPACGGARVSLGATAPTRLPGTAVDVMVEDLERRPSCLGGPEPKRVFLWEKEGGAWTQTRRERSHGTSEAGVEVTRPRPKDAESHESREGAGPANTLAVDCGFGNREKTNFLPFLARCRGICSGRHGNRNPGGFLEAAHRGSPEGEGAAGRGPGLSTAQRRRGAAGGASPRHPPGRDGPHPDADEALLPV